MLKNITALEVKKKLEDKELTFQFICENHSPLGLSYDVLCEMMGFVLGKLQEHQQQVAKALSAPSSCPESSECAKCPEVESGEAEPEVIVEV